jgi:hypothetical protein
VSQANLELLAQGFAGLEKDEPARSSELLAPDSPSTHVAD